MNVKFKIITLQHLFYGKRRHYRNHFRGTITTTGTPAHSLIYVKRMCVCCSIHVFIIIITVMLNIFDLPYSVKLLQRTLCVRESRVLL